MPLVAVHTTLMLPEAIVLESLLEAYGIRFALAGKDIISQCPQFNILYGGVSILVDEADLEDALALIRDAEDVPGYLSIESANFERRPIRNAVMAFVMLLMGAPFPFWYRGARLREGEA
jgi:hypothetical protein